VRKFQIRAENLDKYGGTRTSLVFFIALTTLATLRSLAHIFLPDGGAMSIAGLNTDVAGGQNIVAMFGQWGWAQLILAMGMWLIIFYARALVPLGLVFSSLDWGGRILVGLLKPIEVLDPPPGEFGSYILFPLCLLALWFSFPQRSGLTKETAKQPSPLA
jgi:hypothetical protein